MEVLTDGWVIRINNTASDILACSYWGTNTFDQAYLTELDNEGNIHLYGQTFDGDALIFNAGYSVPNSGQFISKLTSDLEDVIWSTAFGNGNGEPNISPTAFLVDLCNRVYLSGWGGPSGGGNLTTQGLEVTSDAIQMTTDGADFYLMVLTDDASELDYASYYGGEISNEHVDGGTSRFDRKGRIYQSVCAGCGNNDDFPILPVNAVSATNESNNCNNAVFKIDFELPAVIADFFYTPICLPDTAFFQNSSVGGIQYEWDFGNGSTSTDSSPSHLYSEPGAYEVTLVLSDPSSCNLADSITKSIFILDQSGVELEDITSCSGISTQIGIEELVFPGITYSWDNPEFLNNPNISDPIATVNETTTFTLVVDNGVCPSTVSQTIEVEQVLFEVSSDTLICQWKPSYIEWNLLWNSRGVFMV